MFNWSKITNVNVTGICLVIRLGNDAKVSNGSAH